MLDAMFTIATLIICTLLTVPQQVSAIPENPATSSQLLQHSLVQDHHSLVKEFDQLEDSLQVEKNFLEDCRIFLQQYVNEINATYGLCLTLFEAANLVKDNFTKLNIPAEAGQALLAVFRLLDANPQLSPTKQIQFDDTKKAKGFQWPSMWSYFNLNSQRPDPRKHPNSPDTTPPMTTEPEFPSKFYVGDIEIFAGALTAILPIPGAHWLGSLLISDGLKRFSHGIKQLKDERQPLANAANCY